MARLGYDLQLARYDDKGWRATFYTTGMEHSPTSATGTAWERTPWHATQAAGFSGDVRHEGPCLSTHSEISLAPRADAIIFVPATVHDWAAVVLGRAPTLSGEFVTEIGKLVSVFGKRRSLLLRLPEVLSRFCLFQPAWARSARLTCHAAHLL